MSRRENPRSQLGCVLKRARTQLGCVWKKSRTQLGCATRKPRTRLGRNLIYGHDWNAPVRAIPSTANAVTRRTRAFQINEFRNRTNAERHLFLHIPPLPFPPTPSTNVTIHAIALDFLPPRKCSPTTGRRTVARPRRARRFPFGRRHTPAGPLRVFFIVARYYCFGGELPFRDTHPPPRGFARPCVPPAGRAAETDHHKLRTVPKSSRDNPGKTLCTSPADVIIYRRAERETKTPARLYALAKADIFSPLILEFSEG